jgi:Arc/MetJ-type ribon-helix-helix transcriptional regulator
LAIVANRAKLESKGSPYMTIHLPDDVERDILAQVQSGRFASVDAALTEAWLEFQRHRQAQQPSVSAASSDPLLGIFRDAPDEIDEIVAEAMRRRRDEPWRATPGE